MTSNHPDSKRRAHGALIRLVLSASLLGMPLAAPAIAASSSVASVVTFTKAATAYRAGNFDQAVAGFRVLANQGDRNAQYLLALIYRDGRGAPQDAELARFWLARAAEGGHIPAMASWGSTVLNTSSSQPLRKRAIGMLETAARAGDAGAQLALARQFDTLEDDPERQQQAVHWYQMAAQNGLVPAQLRLAVMAIRGIGMPVDMQEGIRWLRRAARRGDATSQRILGLLHERGDGVPANLRQARDWYQRAAAQGEPWAQYQLARLYQDGRGVKADPVQALLWLTLAERHASVERGPWRIVDVTNKLRQSMSPEQIQWRLTTERTDNQTALSLF